VLERFMRNFDISKRKHRALVYLLVSLVINALVVVRVSSLVWIFFYANVIGAVLIFLVGGRPHMYGGSSFNPILAWLVGYPILVFGLFVEIFIVCEFALLIRKGLTHWKKV